MKDFNQIKWQVFLLLFFISCIGQNSADRSVNVQEQLKADVVKNSIVSSTDTLNIGEVPNNITRSIIQDKIGNIWFATFDGIYKYDGQTFSIVTKEISQSRFFSLLEDRNGLLWFGSIGSGVFTYDGTSFKNFTTKDGLLSNEIVCIYEDKIGNVWFGSNGGVSMYDQVNFRNFIISEDTIIEDKTGKIIPDFNRPINEVNSILEDKTGKFWFGTRGYTFVYDGQTFTPIKHGAKYFTNTRWIVEDSRGKIWLGGNDGLWCYDGSLYENITTDFVGYIYEDQEGNIWTSSQSTYGWTLSRYDTSSVENKKVIATEIKTEEGMYFGIYEDKNRNIWVGTLNGILRYDSNTFNTFKG